LSKKEFIELFIMNEGALALLDALLSLSTLKSLELDISYNMITEEAISQYTSPLINF